MAWRRLHEKKGGGVNLLIARISANFQNPKKGGRGGEKGPLALMEKKKGNLITIPHVSSMKRLCTGGKRGGDQIAPRRLQ